MHPLVSFLSRLPKSTLRRAVRPALFALALSLQLSSAASAQGIKTDLNAIYPEPAPPALPRAGGVFTDPTFGTQIMRVTDEIDIAGAGTAYSYWPTFNRDSTRLIAHYSDGQPRIYEFDPEGFKLGPKHVVERPPASDAGMVYTTFEDAIWSGVDPNKLFVHRGTALFAYDARRRSYAKLFDLTARYPAGSYFFQMSRSLDDDTFAFTLRDAQYEVAGYVVYRRSTRRVLHEARVKKLDEVQVDKSGRYLLVKTGEQGKGVVEVKVVDLQTGGVEELKDDAPDFAPAHSDNGTAMVVGGDNWNARLTVRSLATPHRLATALDGRNQWDNDGHVSMLADDESWALLSLFGAASSGWMRREILQVATDGSQRVRRLAHHHSIYKTYFDSPRANISRDGRFVAFSSNWGGRPRHDLFVVRIPPASGESATPTPTPTQPSERTTTQSQPPERATRPRRVPKDR
jgi:hypothetical protein